MQSLTERVFELDPPMGVFDDVVVQNLFPDLSRGARKALVFRAVRTGEVLRLKPGVFCLAERFRRQHPHPFVVAAMLVAPSQVSFETALWHHGLIPEAVREVACSTVLRSRRLSNALGEFSYVTVPASAPRAGVRAVAVVEGAWAFVALPARAIADIVYCRRDISWKRDGSRYLTDGLRIDLEDLERIGLEGGEEVVAGVGNARTRKYILGLARELGQ